MKKEFELKMMMMPNFISYEVPVGKKQDGFKSDNSTIPVGKLSPEEAEQYAQWMKESFLAHWRKRYEGAA